jgi:hypothetical protein
MRSFAIGVALNFLLLQFAGAAGPATAPAAAAATKKTTGTDVSPEALRAQLEQVYRAVRAAVEAKDYPAFLQLVIPAKSGAPPPPGAFEKVALNLLDDYPPLEQLDFAKVDRSGDWAGYYAENRVADPNRTFILFFMFKRAPEGWKMSGRVIVGDIAQVRGQYRTLDEIALNRKFRLPGQKGFLETKN